MRKLLTTLALMVSLAAAAERSSGIWLNEIPLVADSVAGKLYCTLEPGVSHALKGTLRWDSSLYAGISLNGTPLTNGGRDNLSIANWAAGTDTLTVNGRTNRPWALVFSTLPFVVIDCPLDSMSANYSLDKTNPNHSRKYPGQISVIDARCRTKMQNSDSAGMAVFSSEIGIRLRGATSGSKPKKSFNIELEQNGEELDAHLLGYRKDGDWILASEYIDYSRMRNRVMMDLWNSVDPLPYATDNSYQCNGTQGEFVEAFINGEYYGLMCFTDKIDRKKLNLKKTKEATATSAEVKRGLLWKANWECNETYLAGYSARPENDALLWPYVSSKNAYGWEQKYPDDTVTQAFFDPICDLIDSINSSAFKTRYTNWLYEQNVIDYILFVQAFQLIDNQKKNYYLSVRNVGNEKKYLFTLWDLDGSLGRYAGGDPIGNDPKQMAWGEKLGYHNLIHRFKTPSLRPDGFATKMNNRWQYLSSHQLSLQNVRAVMEKYANLFASSGAWERERARWVSSYHSSVKIADTPEQEVAFMMNALEANYARFDQEMASSAWAHDPYDEAAYTALQEEEALYVVGPDIQSTHEDCTVTLPGKVTQEKVEDISSIGYNPTHMNVVRTTGLHSYEIDSVKEVRTHCDGIYRTPAFIPDSLKPYFTFNTRFAPVHEKTIGTDTTFLVQRTVAVRFNEQTASVSGNLSGISVAVSGDSVALTTDLDGLAILVSGQSETGRIYLQSVHPCKLAAAEEGTMLSAIDANCDLTVNTQYALNFYNDHFDGKCVYTTGNVRIESGHLYFLMTGSGTLTDASFAANPALGARAVLAQNIYVEGGQISVKTLGHHGAVGLGAVSRIVINGGNHYLATYDDPLKAGTAISVNGGFTFASSLTNDGLDSKGDLFVTGGTISTCGPEGSEAAYDVNHFYCTGGTVIGTAFKTDYPISNATSQAYFRLNKSAGVQRYLQVTDSTGTELLLIENPAYPTTSILFCSPLLEKGHTYTLLTGSTPTALHVLTTIQAQ